MGLYVSEYGQGSVQACGFTVVPSLHHNPSLHQKKPLSSINQTIETQAFDKTLIYRPTCRSLPRIYPLIPLRNTQTGWLASFWGGL